MVVLVHAFNTNHIRAEPLLTLITISQKTPYKTQVSSLSMPKNVLLTLIDSDRFSIFILYIDLDDLEVSCLKAFG